MAKKKPQLAKSDLVEEMPVACADERAAVEFFERQRWSECPCCPECGDTDVYTMKDRQTGERNKDFRWRCRGCGKLYSVRTGMIFEESLVPMHKWARAIWEASTCKNGVSALELSRKIQVSYKTALFMMNRIRWAMAPDPKPDPMLSGTVEIDETYCGGRPRKRRASNPRGRATAKTPVMAVVQRGGGVRVRVVANVTGETIRDVLKEHVVPGSNIMTDDFRAYTKPAAEHGNHEVVKHGHGEYVRASNPNVHTNTIEGFFSRVKRQLTGTYHAVSKQHLHRYVGQAAFLYNTRELNDGERASVLIGRADGKRLRYRPQNNAA